MPRSWNNQYFAAAAVSGALLLLAGTYLHPMQADPNVPLAAFTEYAGDRHWVATHLLQLSGIAVLVSVLVLLSRRMAGGPADSAASLGAVGAGASLAVAAALQAVDGVALKAMVNAWVAAPEPERALLFHAAFAVRQIEIGLASSTSLLFGLTLSTYGVALWTDSRFPKWLGLMALVGGIPTAAAGIEIAHSGFSERAMTLNLSAGSLLLCWAVALGFQIWRRPLP